MSNEDRTADVTNQNRLNIVTFSYDLFPGTYVLVSCHVVYEALTTV